MRRRQDSRPVIALLVGVAATFAVLDWYLLQTTVDISPIQPAAGSVDAPLSANLGLATPLDKKPATQFQDTVNRPLFNPHRKPVKRDAVAADSVDAQPSELLLVGVMKSGDEPPRALIRFANAQTGKWIAEGEQFNGWKLRKISARSVIVEAAGQSRELTLAAPRRAADDTVGPGSGSKRR
jgi:hypothetical protein